MAAMTGAPPATAVRMMSTSVSRFRPATPDSGTLVARARSLNSGRHFSFNEVSIEDSLGRQVVHGTGAAVFHPMAGPAAPPTSLDDEPPVDSPTYPTPNPYERPLPRGVSPLPQDVWDQHDGPTIARLYAAGELPTMPVADLLAIRVVDWDEGRVHFAMPATEWLSGEDRDIAPGVLALLANAALGGTTAVKLDRRRRQVGIVDDTVSFYRQVPCDGRTVTTSARITHRPADFVVSSMEITDADGQLVAVGHRTSVFLEPRPRPQAKTERKLLTVVFTDLVNSTATASGLGDERWSQLLADHHRIARRQLEMHGGREIKTTGDGFLATFDSPTQGMRCAMAIRDAVRSLGLELRAGIHTGECEVSGGDVVGLAVHVAARLESAARPGQIFVSNTVRELAAGSGVKLVDQGQREFKGLDGTWTVFSVDA
jgi:class 3 adenylate cyclase